EQPVAVGGQQGARLEVGTDRDEVVERVVRRGVTERPRRRGRLHGLAVGRGCGHAPTLATPPYDGDMSGRRTIAGTVTRHLGRQLAPRIAQLAPGLTTTFVREALHRAIHGVGPLPPAAE